METVFSWMMTALFISGIVLLIVKITQLTSHTTPWMVVPTINDINIEELQNAGILGIIFDVDNTLTGYHLPDLDDRVASKFFELKTSFKVAIFSNTNNRERHHQLNILFRGLHIVSPHHKKPERTGFIEAAKMLSLHPSTMVMVGDRTLTDIIGGNMAGMKTIRVTEVLGNNRAPPWYTFFTWLERRVF